MTKIYCFELYFKFIITKLHKMVLFNLGNIKYVN